MNDPVDVDPARAPITVLTRVLPTVVVRRRVYEVAKASSAAASPGAVALADDDEEEPPPSSVDVARALASLRAQDLRRLEAIVSADDEADVDAEAKDAERSASPVKTIAVGSTITVPELAHRIGVQSAELVATLVAGGFFDVTAKSTLTRDLARAAAWMFGFAVEDGPEEPAPPRAKAKARTSAARSKSKPAPKKKSKPAPKKSKRRG